MLYKKSKYNVVINNDERLFFNTKTGCFASMNDEMYNIFISNDTFDINSDFTKYQQEQLESMLKNGLLVNADIDELKMIECISRLRRYDNSILALTIAPTLDCNMDCPYCFEQKNGHVMSGKIEQAIIEYVKVRAKKLSYLQVTWYGGEPLLEVGIITRLSKAFLEICHQNEISYSASIITNGYCLNEMVAKCLKEECALEYAQITIDGCAETHNKRRILKSGKPSFDVIVENIENAIKYLPITIRSNVDKGNIGECKKLIDYLFIDRGWREKERIFIHFSPVQDINETYTVGECYSWVDFAHILGDLTEYLYEKGIYRCVKNAVPEPFSYACGAVASNSVVIDPDGDKYKCYEIIGDKKYAVGNILDDGEVSMGLVDWIMLDVADDCKSCEFLPMCQSACPLKRLKNNTKNCNYSKFSYIKTLEVMYKIHRNYQATKELIRDEN